MDIKEVEKKIKRTNANSIVPRSPVGWSRECPPGNIVSTVQRILCTVVTLHGYALSGNVEVILPQPCTSFCGKHHLNIK